MLVNELFDRIRYAKAKLRNLIYYRLEVEPTVPERFRCQYMHVLRRYRSDTLTLISDIKEYTSKTGDVSFLSDIPLFQSIVDKIDPKVQTDDCLSTIQSLSELFMI